jgi:hypothetical protein
MISEEERQSCKLQRFNNINSIIENKFWYRNVNWHKIAFTWHHVKSNTQLREWSLDLKPKGIPEIRGGTNEFFFQITTRLNYIRPGKNFWHQRKIECYKYCWRYTRILASWRNHLEKVEGDRLPLPQPTEGKTTLRKTKATMGETKTILVWWRNGEK